MKVLITGIAGFVGSQLAKYLIKYKEDIEIIGIDNLSRKGTHLNIPILKSLGVHFIEGDIRNRFILDSVGKIDWIIDCAAEPSVLAGTNGASFDLVTNNLFATINLLEKCKNDNAGFILPSTSRVYSINALNNIPLDIVDEGYVYKKGNTSILPEGFSINGVNERFSTKAPLSIYGATKLASEVMAMEYHYAYGFPVRINRCGVIAGPGQFGKIDQGIVSFWIYQYIRNASLSFIGYGGTGFQSRDILHPYDLSKLIMLQLTDNLDEKQMIFNVGGGQTNLLSLKQLDNYCKEKINPSKLINKNIEGRVYDMPMYYTDNTLVSQVWGWEPEISLSDIVNDIIRFAKDNPDFITAVA